MEKPWGIGPQHQDFKGSIQLQPKGVNSRLPKGVKSRLPKGVNSPWLFQ